MYKTPVSNIGKGHPGDDGFDWEAFFSEASTREVLDGLDPTLLLLKCREHLKEDKFRLALALNKVMKRLLKGRESKNPRILELGAATGFLTRWFIAHYGGTGVLVDSSPAAHQAFCALEEQEKRNITYLECDFFKLDLAERFDLVCSFGLVEHFADKRAVLDVHRTYAATDGMIVILVPMDSLLTRVFLELHPELNLGYRELLTEKEFRSILTRHGFAVSDMERSSGYSYDFLAALCE